jgi:hypothetical protein
MAQSGEYEYITMQRSWRTATNRVGQSKWQPDVIGVRRDGKVDAFEVRSDSQTRQELIDKLRAGRKSLPSERHGRIDVIEAEP